MLDNDESITIKHIEIIQIELDESLEQLTEFHKLGKKEDIDNNKTTIQSLLETTKDELSQIIEKFSDALDTIENAEKNYISTKEKLTLFYMELSQAGIENPSISPLEELLDNVKITIQGCLASFFSGITEISDSDELDPQSLTELTQNSKQSIENCHRINGIIDKNSNTMREITSKISRLEINMKNREENIDGTTATHRFEEARIKIENAHASFTQWITLVMNTIISDIEDNSMNLNEDENIVE